MKKITIITLCLLALGTTVFAYDLSVGFGGTFGFVNDTWENFNAPDNTRDLLFSRTQYGGFAFFGTRYTEFNFSMRYSINDIERKIYAGEDAGKHDNPDDTTLMLSVGAYGKFPISLGRFFVIFPTIGVDFDAVDEYLYLWGRGGLGLDIFFTERFFLRGQALYGYGINIPIPKDKTVVAPGHAPFFKLGLGWMF